MIFLHHSHSHLTQAQLATVEQDDELRPIGKPKGLWLSVQGEQDWATWCIGNNWPLGQLTYQVKLAEDSRILYIETMAQLEQFAEKYRVINQRRDFKMDWRAVARKYQGIVIAPCQRDARFSMFWYYGWDCASGCVWDKDAIASIELVPELSNKTEADKQLELSA